VSSYRLSPKPSLDPKYTVQAVQQFQRFVEDYPNSDLVPEAEELLQECRTKLAEKEFKSAILYRKMQNYTSALVYFNSVLDNFYDTEFVRPSMYWRGECLFKLKRFEESVDALKSYVDRYPKDRFVSRANRRLKQMQAEIAEVQETNGTSH